LSDYWNVYGRLSLILAGLGSLLLFEAVFIRPLAFVTGMSEAGLTQWLTAVFVLAASMLIGRFLRRDIIHGVLERRSGQAVPPLVGDLAGSLVIFAGLCVILAFVFKKDVTGVVATGGVGLMVIGLALRDMLLAAFTGVLLNVEKPFKAGDLVRINDKIMGTIERITWRTTELQTPTHETVVIPNLSLSSATIVNLDKPDSRVRRSLELTIDYNTSVESAERILFAAALGASGVKHVRPPAVNARRMEKDGVVYEITFTITNHRDTKSAEHAIIKSVLNCMRDAGIMVATAKSEVIHSRHRVQIADRSLDSFTLVQQCRLFRGLPAETCQAIAKVLIEHYFPAGSPIVRADEPRFSLYIVGEGMARRIQADRTGTTLVEERLIATEFFGRHALFGCQPQPATVMAETNVLVYELSRHALAGLLAAQPGLVDELARALAQLSWRESSGDPSGTGAGGEPDAAAFERLVHLHHGQIEACYEGANVHVGAFARKDKRVLA
jgi:small-conductance mechanosensitive channel